MKRKLLTLASLLVAALAVQMYAPSDSPGPFGPTVSEAGRACPGAGRAPNRMKMNKAAQLVRCLVNKRRANHGARRLKAKKKISEAAVSHTKRMRSAGCFSHTCPGEPALSGRLTRSDYLPCSCSWSAGETIAYGKGRRRGSPKAVVKAWMRSSPHRATLLTGSYEHIGVGVRRGSPYNSKKKRYATYTVNLGYKR